MAPIGDELDRLALRAGETPDKPAVIDDRPGGFEKIVTFREFNALVNQIANALVDTGFCAGERLFWAGRNCVDVMAVQHAARKAGGFSISLNHRLTKGEVQSIAEVAEPTFAWVAEELRDSFLPQDLPTLRDVVVFDGEPKPGQVAREEFLAGRSTEEPKPHESSRGGFDPIVIFTSGTTGLPKGVLRHGLGQEEIEFQTGLLGNGSGVFIVTGSLSHGGPNGMASNSLLIGGSVVLQHRFDPEDWLRLVEKYRVTNTYSAPFPIRHICGLPDDVKRRYDTTSLRTAIASAAQWPHSLKEGFFESFPDCALWEIYGSSELASVTVQAPDDHLRKPGSCGLPAKGVEIILVDENDEVVTDPHTPGVLYARGSSIFNAYLGNDEAFDEARRGEFLTTFDIAYFDEDGFYYICDREKDMLISGGSNVYPKEIENVLESHPAIFESAVIGLPDEEWGERPLALVMLADGASLTPDDILSFCRENLAGYKVPKTVELVDELPHMVSGKLDKRGLRARYAD